MLLKSTISAGVSFHKVSHLYYNQNRQLFHYEGTVPYILLKIPKRLNIVIFQNNSERLLLEIKICSKVDHKKDTRPASVNVIRFSL